MYLFGSRSICEHHIVLFLVIFVVDTIDESLAFQITALMTKQQPDQPTCLFPEQRVNKQR